MDRRRFVRGMVGAGTGLALVQSAFASSVTDTGAVGDGQSDDTEAIQRAVNQGGVVYFPQGTYSITKTIPIDLAQVGNTSLLGDGCARVIMRGEGPAFHFIGTHEGNASPGNFKEQVWDRERMPLICGFEIRGGHPQADGLRFECTMQATVSQMLIRRCRVGIHFVKRNRNALIDACHIYDNEEIGVFFDHVNLHQCIIASSHISYNKQAGICLLGGEMRNFQITGNDIEYNHEATRQDCADILVDVREEGTSFREGTIDSNTIQALVSPNGANVRILGGTILRTSGMLAITGNMIGNQEYGLHLENCRGVSITGNSIYSNTQRSIHMERCANMVIGQNTIDWNPDNRGKQFADGLLIHDCDGINISGLILENCFQGSQETGGAIEIRESRHVTLSDAQVLDARFRGVVLDNATCCRVQGCTILDRRTPPSMLTSIQITGASQDNWIMNNMVNAGSLRIADNTAQIQDTMEIS